MSGEGTQGNPWSQFGKPAGEGDGGQQQQQQQGGEGGKTAETVTIPASELAALKNTVSSYEQQFKKLGDDMAGQAKKFEVIDRITKALTGDSGQSQDSAAYRAVFADLKEVARHAAPGFYKAMQLLEEDPEALDRFSRSVGDLQARELVSLNSQAHSQVIAAAKAAGLKAANPEALAKMVYPYETAITQIINSNPELRKSFLSGNVEVVKEIFDNLFEPHKQARLQEKRTSRPPQLPQGTAPRRGLVRRRRRRTRIHEAQPPRPEAARRLP